MSQIRVLLAGSPQFSVPIFEEVIQNFDVVGIIAQPDRAANRGYKLTPPPTKLLAQKYNIPLFQPEKIGEISQDLARLEFDFLLTAAFGQYIPMRVLDLPKKAAVNIHGSLLPKYRGASPVQHSLLMGDKETGITLIYMTKEMDAGDMIAKASFEVLETDTAKEVFEKMSLIAKDNIVSWLKDLYDNKLIAEKQDENFVSLSPKINKSFAEFFLTDDAKQTLCKIKALNDNPGAFILLNNKRLKVYRASLNPIKNALVLNLKNGALYCYEYQFEGKKRVFISYG